MILRILDESVRVAWSDFCYLRRNLIPIVITALITPFLYLITFVYGLGNNVDLMEGASYIAFVILGIVALINSYIMFQFDGKQNYGSKKILFQLR